MAFTPLAGGSGRSGFRSSFATASTDFRPSAATAPADGPAGSTPAGLAPIEPGPDLEALLEQARAEGAAMERAAMEEELGSLAATNALLATALEDLESLRATTIRQAARDVADLVLALTTRILDRSLALHPEALPTLLENALARFPDRDALRIRVPAHALESLRERVEPSVAEALVADPTLEDGVVVISEHGSVESTLSAALEAVEEAVRTWAEVASC